MSILQKFRYLFRRKRTHILVAEKLSGQSPRTVFADKIVRSMQEYPEEWSVKEWKATHKSGVVIDCVDYTARSTDPGMIPESLRAGIVGPVRVLVKAEEAEKLGNAFDYLSKWHVIKLLHMDED